MFNPIVVSVSKSEAIPEIPLWKQTMDVFCIICLMPLWLPLMLLISLVIKISSSGPVFFKQERVGFMGIRFMCLKFRSMKINADTRMHQSHIADMMASNMPMTKMDAKGDPRLIRFGALLRSSGLDELPQLLNILRGEMSLVGPRPCLPYEHDNYLPRHKKRCETLPGLTGLWQVNGKNKTTFRQMIAMDIWYAKNKSIGTDLWIIFKTFPALFSQVREMSERRSQKSRVWFPTVHTADSLSE